MEGVELDELRHQCWMRDKGICQRCKKPTYFGLYQEHDDSFHMAHRRGKRMWGDSLEQVQTECGRCHRKWHLYGPTMKKPVPKKDCEAK